jgi:hypothetical protein
VELDIIGEQSIGGVEIPQVGEAVLLRAEIGSDREFDDSTDLGDVEDDVLGLAA